MIYVFDTNAITDILKRRPQILTIIRERQHEHVMCVCSPVHYEVRRGLLAINATTQMKTYETQIQTQFEWVGIQDEDWEQAAELWVAARSKGKQLSDIDLLLAAIAIRLDAIIVSADLDFDALPVKRESWR